MKKYSIIIAAAAICLLTACSKEKELRAPEEEQNIAEEVLPANCISAVIGEVATSASVDDVTAAFSWNTGDKIAVWSGSSYQISDALASTYDGSNSAIFSFASDINADRADFAVFPASLVYNGTDIIPECLDDHTTSALTIVLPGSYTLAQVQNNVSPTPMIAANTPGTNLTFKSICALIRITVENVPKDAKSLKVSFPGKKVQGFFTLSSFTPGSDGVVLDDALGDDDSDILITDLGISAFTNSLVINVPVPVGVASSQEYLYVRVGAYDAKGNKINSIDTPLKVVSSVPTAWAPGRKASRKVTSTLPYFLTNRKNNQKVVFAPGNLQATITVKPKSSSGSTVGAANNWRFAAHQWEAYGDCDGNKLANVGDNIDLFAWVGASATYDYQANENYPNNKYGVLFPDTDQSANCGNKTETVKWDYGEIFNGSSYPNGTWRMPKDSIAKETACEMDVVLTRRSTTSSYVAAKATILQENGTDTLARGLIVFPDTYTHPYGVKALVNYKTTNNKAGHWADNILTFAEWEILENVGGCAFLPVTSLRDRFKHDDGKYYVNTSKYFGEAAYWSDFSINGTNVAATIICDKNYCPYSKDGDNKTNINPKKSVNRSRGCAIRLVRDVN